MLATVTRSRSSLLTARFRVLGSGEHIPLRQVTLLSLTLYEM